MADGKCQEIVYFSSAMYVLKNAALYQSILH